MGKDGMKKFDCPPDSLGNSKHKECLQGAGVGEQIVEVFSRGDEGNKDEEWGQAMNLDNVSIIEHSIFPFIERNCISNGEYTNLYKGLFIRICYQGAGVEYQGDDGNWYDTSGVNPEEYVDRPQRINYSLREKYKNKGGIIINLLDESGKCIRQKESDNIL